MAWPAKVPTTISASAGNAARRISAKMRFPPLTEPRNHEGVTSASKKNGLVDIVGKNLWTAGGRYSGQPRAMMLRPRRGKQIMDSADAFAAPVAEPFRRRFVAFHKWDRNFFLGFLAACWLGVIM